MAAPSPKLTHHYGRGGAGNVTSKEGVVVEAVKTTPTLKGEKYTTGRGGAGNMAKNDPDNPEEARQAQDVDVPPMLLPEGENRTGRGGAANVYKPSPEELERNRLHNEKIRRESFNKKEQGMRQKIKDMAKEKLPGKSPPREATK